MPSGGSRISRRGGSLTYYFAQFFRKLHENGRIWTGGASLTPLLDPPLVPLQFKFLVSKARNLPTAGRSGRNAMRRKTQLKLACCQCTPDYYLQGNLVRQSNELRDRLFNLTYSKSLSKQDVLIKREHA